MKKITYILATLLLVFTLSSCIEKPDPDPDPFELCEEYPTHVDCIEDDPTDPVDPVDPVEDLDFLDIYYMNDFHGAILEDGSNMGFSKIGNYLNHYSELYPDNTLILAGGDMLQGSALSNYYFGLSTIDIMDEIGFDALALGNHEFDWGLDVVTQYFDEDETNGEADFPLLGANVFYKGTTTMPDHIDPYAIIEKGDLKIGIIGTIGFGLEYSIAYSKVEDYEFAYPVPIIEEHAIHLRTVEECDIVIWMGHDSGYINDELIALSGDASLDALFNAHSHSEYADTTERIPQVQSGGTGEYVGHVRLSLNDDNEVISYTAENVNQYSNAYFLSEYQPVQMLIAQYIDETAPLFNAPIITSGEYLSRYDLSTWLSKLMHNATGVDIAFHNSGGTRDSIDDYEVITLATLYDVWPFDNVIKTVYLDGSVVNNLKASGLIFYSEETEFLEGVLYQVATNDYVFDKPENPFLDGEQIVYTGIIIRDLVEDELLLQSSIYDEFLLANEIQTTN